MAAITSNYNGTVTSYDYIDNSAYGTSDTDANCYTVICNANADIDDLAADFREDRFIIYLQKFSKGVGGWCDNKHRGLIYCLLYYKIADFVNTRIKLTVEAWKKQAGRYYSGLG